MKKDTLYFKDEDAEFCCSLKVHLKEAEEDELEQITLLKAIPDFDNPDFIWCAWADAVGERSECKKKLCDAYESKSGRGVCKHRGKLYEHGEAITFHVSTGKEVKS